MGVEIETVTPGDGRTFPKKGQTCVVHYVGVSLPGPRSTKCVSGVLVGVWHPFLCVFTLGEWVWMSVRGWERVIVSMSVGQRAKLICSPDFAYGNKGHPGIIPPNATLIFDVELLSLE
uniref:peptidylprolyl isomerase n=1 Tax=Xiphophorus couchianus TaxID=32473 RepID=A0A3B5KR29_9TELE